MIIEGANYLPKSTHVMFRQHCERFSSLAGKIEIIQARLVVEDVCVIVYEEKRPSVNCICDDCNIYERIVFLHDKKVCRVKVLWYGIVRDIIPIGDKGSFVVRSNFGEKIFVRPKRQ